MEVTHNRNWPNMESSQELIVSASLPSECIIKLFCGTTPVANKILVCWNEPLNRDHVIHSFDMKLIPHPKITYSSN